MTIPKRENLESRNATVTPFMGIGLAVALAAAACSGGSSGREPTVVTGNVRSATGTASTTRREPPWFAALRGWLAEAIAQVPALTVAIEGASAFSVTDETGAFRIEGNQFGPATLRFTGSGADGTLAVTLPAGGFLRLVNVEVAGSNVTVEEQRTEFRGALTGLDCPANLLQVLAGDLVAFRVRIQSGTVIQDQAGQTVRCQDLITGPAVKVLGTVDSSGTVLATLIQLSAASGGSATHVEFDGLIDSLDCPNEITVNRGTEGMTRVEISSTTDIRDGSGRSVTCTDLADGDSVHVEGKTEAGDVTASRIDQASTATATPTP